MLVRFRRSGLAATTLAVALVATSFGGQAVVSHAAGLTGKVYLLLPDTTTIRFVKWDQPNIIAAFKRRAPGLSVQVLNANNNAAEQTAQFESALANGAKGIILIATDPSQASGMLAAAKAQGVPVVSYAHEIVTGSFAYQVTIPFAELGSVHGKYLTTHFPHLGRPLRVALMWGDLRFLGEHLVEQGWQPYLRPLLKSHHVQVVCTAHALNFTPASVQRNMEQCLTKTNNRVDAVITDNDDMGGGAEAALTEQGLQNKVKIYGGYDSTLDGVRRVLAGRQDMDLRAPYKHMADVAAQLLIDAMTHTAPRAGLINGSIAGGKVVYHVVPGGVPTAILHNTSVTPKNMMQTVVRDGVYTKAEICGGIAARSTFCKKG